MSSLPDCPAGGKKSYRTSTEAFNSIGKMRRKNFRGSEMRSYVCYFCGYFHLTSHVKRQDRASRIMKDGRKPRFR